jgi:hypothetical protein
VNFAEWKIISDYLTRRLLTDAAAYSYFFSHFPEIVEQKIVLCVDTPLDFFHPLPSPMEGLDTN